MNVFYFNKGIQDYLELNLDPKDSKLTDLLIQFQAYTARNI